jgi:hypothetical protein
MIPCPKTPIPEDLMKLGVVQFARDSYPNPQYDRLDFLLSMRGYELYTMESLKRDYKEWKEPRESPKKWQDLLEPLPAKFGIHDKQPRHDKFEIAYAKREFKEYKDDLKKLPTLEKWAKAEIGKEFYQMVLNHSNLYHLIRYGIMTTTTSGASIEAIASMLERQYNKMREAARKNFVVLDPKLTAYVGKIPRFPHWIVAP